MSAHGIKRTRRPRVTRKRVRVAEALARTLISLGGICTILAVSLICIFLVWVVVPLFGSARISAGRFQEVVGPSAPKVLRTQIDEYKQILWSLRSDGQLELVRLDTGELLERRGLVEGEAPSAVAYSAENGALALGFPNGEVRLGRIAFASRFVEEESVPAEVRALSRGERAPLGSGIVERTPEGQLRVQELVVELEPPARVGRNETGSGIVLIDVSILQAGPMLCVLTEDGVLSLHGVRRTRNLMTRKETITLSSGILPYEDPRPGERPAFLALLGGGDGVILAWRDGHALRYDARAIDQAVLAEELDFVPEPGAELRSLEFLAGKRTLIAGDSLGRVRGWFRIKPESAATVDGALFVPAHELEQGESAVSAIAPSPRSRTFAVGFQNGEVKLYFMTNGRELGTVRTSRGRAVDALALAPREHSFLAHVEGGMELWDLESHHPEASFAALFHPVWYEGYPEPAHVWQSSSGTDDFEAKLGLMPLVFGTIKATFYSMLFGVPLALLAAIFSSEFLSPRLRVAIKSTIEIMASLPSVVLGFLAAIVIAPFVQGVVPAVLTAFFTIPFALLLGARAWQLLPQRLALRLGGLPRLLAIAAMVPVGLLAASALGPRIEALFFGGDVQGWLSSSGGSPIGGWLLLLVPLSALVCALLAGRLLDPWMRKLSLEWSRTRCAVADLLRFGALALVVVLLALAGAAVLGAFDLDPRGSYIGTYVQRNALVVGFLMGFAIIPIIYTLAEDALTSVPEHLRLASLGAGATPWQTAVRVIIPTAASGIFSAVMIGLGRAVGETMIVLMAVGNTAVMEWNVFSGFRTLSANIAVELPEAVKNDTHYRTLFLAALTLFVMTFLVNTAAELVRQRFRKRAFQL